MASAELVLATLGGADLSSQAFKGANDAVKEKVPIVETVWTRTALQIEFLGRVVHSLGEEHCCVQVQVLEMLKSKFLFAHNKIESIQKKGSEEISRWKYVMVRDSLDQAIESLERWQRIFDPSWFLILRIADRAIDSELTKPVQAPTVAEAATAKSTGSDSRMATARKLHVCIMGEASDIHVGLNADGLDWGAAEKMTYSDIKIVKRAGGSSRLFAIDSIPFPPGTDPARVRADAETLAKKLKHVEYGCGILPCQGLIKHRDAATRRLAAIDFVSSIPTQFGYPKNLRQMLAEGTTPLQASLSAVLGIARQLAEAVSFLHTCAFVHKNIRPETILLLAKEPDSADRRFGDTLGPSSAYLVGFDWFRGATSHTARRGDNDWQRDPYRHPSRQGLLAQKEYIMQHDVYSFGVCLLELGVGCSFVEYSPGDVEGELRARPSEELLSLGAAVAAGADKRGEDKDGGVDVAAAALQRLCLGPGLSSAEAQPMAGLKDHLVGLARARLPARMGDRYTAVVVTCLTCLDPVNEDFGDEEDMRDEDGILIGVRFIEKVLFRLSSISV